MFLFYLMKCVFLHIKKKFPNFLFNHVLVCDVKTLQGTFIKNFNVKSQYFDIFETLN